MIFTARQRKIGIAGALSVFAAAGGGLLIGLLPGYQAPVLSGAMSVAVLIGVFLAMLPRWRRLDHMQRDSRLSSWYWGGSFGAAAGLVLALLFTGARSPFFAGAAMIWLLQFTGYAVARLWWWRAHRADAA
jgi:hypothetical protein